MLDDFPKTHGQDRENLILDIVKNQRNRVEVSWGPLYIEEKGHKAIFTVMHDALKIDGVRINLTAITEQKIADLWNASLLTAKLSDYIWNNADIRLNPRLAPISATTAEMINHSQSIDKLLQGKVSQNKLISTVGKDWVLDNKLISAMPNQAVNHGWHFEGNSYSGINGNINPSLLKDKNGQYWKMIQALGACHNSFHSDISQTCRLVFREVFVDGKEMDFFDIVKNKDLCFLACHAGPLSIIRQPGA